MKVTSKIYVAGHRGLVGSAITRRLQSAGYANLLLPGIEELDLLVQAKVDSYFEINKPDYVFLAAAKVGGIMANNIYRADFIYENLQIQNNIISSAWKHGVKKLLFLGSSCIYPKECPQPMREEYLLTAPLEYTNEPYAVAKIAGIKMCEAFNIQYGTDFISVMPTNLYGPNDNYNLAQSHVLPALIRKMHLGKCLENNDISSIREDFKKRPMAGFPLELADESIVKGLEQFGIHSNSSSVEIKLWGSGKPRREFLYSDDLADAVVFVMENISFHDLAKEVGEVQTRNTHLNIGYGEDISIFELAMLVKQITGFKGAITWDDSKPDGTFQKLMDVSRLTKMGWKAKVNLQQGVQMVYENYIK